MAPAVYATPPTASNTTARTPLRRLDPGELEHDRHRGPAPDDREHDRLPGAPQHDQADWGVRPGDQQVDPHVVDPAHPLLPARRPHHAMIERARGEHRRDGPG